MKLKSIIIFLLLSQYSVTAQEKWTYEDSYRDIFLYLHSLVNYDYNASWKFEFQKNLLSKNNMALNYSSVTTADLMTDSYLNLNQQLGDGWRFKSVGQYRANRFETEQVRQLNLGFEKTIVNNIGLFFLVNPIYEKDEIDVSFGAQFTSDNREQYIVTEVELEDFIYNEKNDFDGKYLQKPINFKWQFRYTFDRFTLFSYGKLGTGFERIFEDTVKSPELRYHSRDLNSANVTLNYRIQNDLLAALTYDHYFFDESKNYTTEENNYVYKNKINRIGLEVVYNFKEVNRFRVQTNYILQDASSKGFREHDYKRNESANGIFYQRTFSSHALEAGYMFSIFDWDYFKYYNGDSELRRENSTKLMLGYQYTFKNNAMLMFSLSHEIDTDGFGGGNLQYMMFF